MASDYMYPSLDDMQDRNPVMEPQMGYAPMPGCPFMYSMMSPAAISPAAGCPFIQNIVSPPAMGIPARCPLMAPYMISPILPGTMNPEFSQMVPNIYNPMTQGMGTAVPSWNYPAMNPMMQMSPEAEE